MNNVFINIIPALFMVIILILGLSFLYRRKKGTSRLIELIEYRSFGQKIAVAAMKINKDIYILGITPNDMKVIEKINEDNILQTPKLENSKDTISEKIKRLRELKERL